MVGLRLVALREEVNMQQKELAQLLNVTQGSVSAYERGDTQPPDEIKIMIAQHFNVSLDYLIGACDTKFALTRNDLLYLPKGFSTENKEKLIEYMNLLYENQELKKIAKK